MTAYTPLNGLPYPQPTDTADLPLHLQSLAEGVDGRSVMRFGTAAQRDTVVTTPARGMVAWLDTPGQLTHHTGAGWLPVGAVPVFLYNNDAGTTTSTTPAETLTGAVGDPVVAAFTAPTTGRVIVTVGCWMHNSVAANGYMGATIRKVSDGSVYLASTIDRAANVYNTDRSSVTSQFLVTGLAPGTVYSATPTYWSSVATPTANTVAYDNRFIRVDPVH
ncbi:hypothetical protein F9278_18075 [Streptomyces phaeolivaceus]|uniref:Uncharacterized protein n=1 Tax=Streptomyces phaeolivaceus TaxID=2653200 RepID=A0A5P8K459_9ACTN|nr:hypothetical protein [Streptomyces phaeolivaceus]QFQ97816.1 hypothetical protein F9278_18075 [Streptomyces phaeolivaceus]